MNTVPPSPAATSTGRRPVGTRINSVRVNLIAGFGVLAAIIVCVVGGSAWMVRDYQSKTGLMEKKADTALLLQGAESHVGTAGLMLQRYAVDGDQVWLPEIIQAADAAGQNFDTVLAREAAAGDQEDLARLQQLDTGGDGLRSSLEQVVALRASGDITGAMITLDTMVGPFREYRAALRAAAEDELAEVATVQAEAARSGDIAFWLLVTSGVIGITLGVAVSALIARSIMRPLASLEATARTVALGDMSARAPASGPRELAKVGEALNGMMATIEERTEELRLSNEELKERNRQLLEARAQAASDPLTGLLNHRKFHEKVRQAVCDAESEGTTVGLIMLDVDNFKQVNDRLGHVEGDQLLRQLAATIGDCITPEQSYRYGGDEFAIILPGCGPEETEISAQRLLKAISKRWESQRGRVTVSLGIASYPAMAANAEELVYRADMAMNWAKSSGKNRVGDWESLIRRKESAAPARAARTR